MNILVSKYNTNTISLLVAYISLFPEERVNSSVICSKWSCRSLRHMFSTVSPALDNKVPSDLTQSMEPMTEIIEGLHASASECARLKKLVGSDFVNFSLCVNPQLFKLVELSM